MRIGDLRRVLRDSGVLGEAGEPAPAELADILWLAGLRRPSQPAPPPAVEDPPPEDDRAEREDRSVDRRPAPAPQAPVRPPLPTTGPDVPEPAAPPPAPASPVLATLPVRGTPSTGVLVSAAARPQLSDSLTLARAMRPLRRRVPSATRRVLDEEATADLQAEQRLWLPALAPDSEPAFDLALVIDDSESMALWSEQAREFRLLCERLGAFRDVRLWRLSATGDDAGAKAVLRGLSPRSKGRDERELVDPSGRRLILVVTDGVHPWWRPAGPLGPVLARWALASPLAIVQPIPQRLWNRSPLHPVIEEFRPGWPGSGPTIRHTDQGRVAVPILELAPAAMRRWAGVISGSSGATRLPAISLSPTGAAKEAPADNAFAGPGADGEDPDPVQLVRDFRASVSPAAYQLAGYLSAAPLTLPVMRLVQESVMPDTGPAELAEVFLSGLLRKSSNGDQAGDVESTSYLFAAGVRTVLQSTLTRGEALTVIDQVGNYLVRGRQGGRPFPVLLHGQSADSDIQAAFGRIAGSLLDRIGGSSAEAIRREATAAEPAGEEAGDGWLSYGPGLRKIHQPVLFVGLGGAGCDIGAELERQLRIHICGPEGNDFRTRHGRDEMLPYQLPSCIQFVYADMNQADLDRLPARVVPPDHYAAVRPTASYVRSLAPDVVSYPELAVRLRLRATTEVHSWLPEGSRAEPKVNPLFRGSGQFPTIGRAALFSTFLEGISPLERDIQQAVGRLAGSGEDLQVLGGRPPRGVDVFVAFSVAGGTGAGIFYDYLHLIADTLARHSGLRVRIYPLVLMPSAFPEGLGGGRPAQLNAARALMDLFRLVDQQNGIGADDVLRGASDSRPADPDDVAVSYPGGRRLVMRPGTMPTGFLFSQPAGATRADMRRTITSLVLSLVGTEMSPDDDRFGEHHQSFADSFVNQAADRQVTAESGIGGRGVSTALAASLTVPIDELAELVGYRLLRESVGEISLTGDLERLSGALSDFARADEEGFSRRAADLHRRRSGVSYLLPFGSGQTERFYQRFLRRLHERLARDGLLAVGSTTADALQALAGADMWPESVRLSTETSPENALSYLRGRVRTEVKKFLRAAAPGEQPLVPRLQDLIVAAAGPGRSQDDVEALRGKLAGLLPANFRPPGSGHMRVLITYPSDADSEKIKSYVRSSINLPVDRRVVEEFRSADTESISVLLFRTMMGITEVDEARDVLRVWASALTDPRPTDLLPWRQRTGYDSGYLATTEQNRVAILHRLLCALWNGKVTVVGPEESPQRVNVHLAGGVTMTLPLIALGRASSWASLLRAYELWALDDDELHRRFAYELLRELPDGLGTSPLPPSGLYVTVTGLAASQIELLDDLLTTVSPQQRSQLIWRRDFWAATLPGALDQRFDGIESPIEETLRRLEDAVGRDSARPQEDSWMVAVHQSADDLEPVGSGVVIDGQRILTCAHVIVGLPAVWADFPRAEGARPEGRRRVERVVYPDSSGPADDLVLLVLADPVPAGVTPARLRLPTPDALVGKRWWASGFPSRYTVARSAEGRVISALGNGWIRLNTDTNYLDVSGFSGGGLWSPDDQAVVAVVSDMNTRGTGRAVTLHQASQVFPGQDLSALAERPAPTDASEVAPPAWGWSLADDPEAARHWGPRARGVMTDSEAGYRFQGRTAALRTITNWLDRDVPDGRVLVITGAPGSGKSAVLGRIVTTADPDLAAQLPATDLAVRATAGSVACAIHAKGLTALEIATRIARAASAAIPEQVRDFAPALREALVRRGGSRFNVIIDALDEAAEPRAAIERVILPLMDVCSDVGGQVVVGTRRAGTDGDLLARFGTFAPVVDLDKPEFFAEEDLAAYALATLQLSGGQRADNPYADQMTAGAVAARIAALSAGNFLVAGLTARTHGLYDDAPADPATVSFSSRVDNVLFAYLKSVPPAEGASAEELLTALAFAEPPGLPVGLWRVAARALGSGDITEAALARFARSSAASFLLESHGADGAGTAEYRLFHPALSDALRHARLADERADERALTTAFLAAGRAAGWGQAPGYLLRSLPAHAARAGLTDDLLADEDYRRHAARLGVVLTEPRLADAGHVQAGELGPRWQRRGDVCLLRLDGLSAEQAVQAVAELMDIDSGLDNAQYVLVLDEAARLSDHQWAYQRLDASYRVEQLICIAQGPRDQKELSLPGNLGGSQGSPVLWVSDPIGVDWRPGRAVVAVAPEGNFLDRLVEVLSTAEVFRAVYGLVSERLPGRVANPGLRLARDDVKATVFARALVAAIDGLFTPAPGLRDTYHGLVPAELPPAAGRVVLDEGLTLAQARDHVRDLVAAANSEVARIVGLGRAFRRGDIRDRAIDIGAALADLRGIVIEFLTRGEADAARGTEGSLPQAFGIRFAPGPEAPATSPFRQLVTAAIRRGTDLPDLSGLLEVGQQNALQRWQELYRPQVEEACPQALLDKLADPPSGWRAYAGAQRKLNLDDATRAARDLVTLVLDIAAREWSPAAPTPAELSELHAVLVGVQQALVAYADRARVASAVPFGVTGPETEGDRSARLAEGIAPVLQDLVIQTLDSQAASPDRSEAEVQVAASGQAAALLEEWTRHVAEHGLLSRPPFAVSQVEAGAYAQYWEEEIDEIREALQAPIGSEMRQLCSASDLGLIDVNAPRQAVRFASRLFTDSFTSGGLPEQDLVRTSSGSYAGTIRLLPLVRGTAVSYWDQPGSASSS